MLVDSNSLLQLLLGRTCSSGGFPTPVLHRCSSTHAYSCCTCRGKVADAVIMERKGYGFVTFADTKSAMEFLEVRRVLMKQQQHLQSNRWSSSTCSWTREQLGPGGSISCKHIAPIMAAEGAVC